MRTYTIIGGVNGTGKSSLTGVLRTQTKELGTIIDVDRITAAGRLPPIEGGKAALRRILECLEKGVSFTQETTLSGKRTEATASEAKRLGYSIRLYYVGLDTLEECMERIANRVRHGGHDIPAEAVERRFSGRWEAVARVLPYCDEARFFDNDNGFAEVAEYINGELILKGEYRPAWVRELPGIWDDAAQARKAAWRTVKGIRRGTPAAHMDGGGFCFCFSVNTYPYSLAQKMRSFFLLFSRRICIMSNGKSAGPGAAAERETKISEESGWQNWTVPRIM